MAEWDGRPLNPERDGWHWLDADGPVLCEWRVSRGWMDETWCTHAADLVYLGPCLTPSEVAAQVEQALWDGIEAAMRVVSERASARHKEAGSCISDRSRKHMHIRADEAGQIVTYIRALLPGDSE